MYYFGFIDFRPASEQNEGQPWSLHKSSKRKGGHAEKDPYPGDPAAHIHYAIKINNRHKMRTQKLKQYIGRIIRDARRSSGMSQMRLAEKIGISYQQVQKYEGGTSELTLTRLHQMAEALQIPVSSFLHSDNLIVSDVRAVYGKLSDDEETLLRLFRKIKGDKSKKIALSVIRAIAEQGS
ncbi:MAG: helix-turn-helix transcriptional regulator [Nitrospiraceae bacterium]|nr:helix-turn-helix transcriptional regulator [Nitrospiraceae bacterium]